MISPSKKIPLAALAGILAVAALAGCGGQRTSVPGAVNTGTYPNLNILPQSAATPISAGEKASMYGQLGAAKNAQAQAANASAPSADPLLLKKIADDHGEETLKQIEQKK